MSRMQPFNNKNKRTAPPQTAHNLISGRTLLGRALSIGLLAAMATPSHAAMLRLGTVDVQIDTTASLGATILMSDRKEQFLPISNGGPKENKIYVNVGTDGTTGASPAASTQTRDVCDADGSGIAYGGFCQDLDHAAEGTRPNFDGSINTDDGRLNFDNGDLVSAPFKVTSEIEAHSGNWTGFARISAFYDATLMDDGSFERGGLSEKGESRAGQNLYLLDAYLDYDGEVADMPFTVRAGRQVINWGEATFILGGNSAFSPIDVAAIRRPGAGLSTAFRPVLHHGRRVYL